MTSNQTGWLIGAIFGLAFIQVNAGALPQAVGIPLRVLAIAAFIRLFIALRRARTATATAGEGRAPRTFGRGYLLVVAAEVVAGLAGLVLINRVLHTPDATVGWIALVVGLHFFGLAAVWHMPSLRWLAAAMSTCGAAGLALAASGSPTAVIATVAGITPGALLLGAVWRNVSAAKAPQPAQVHAA
ncbi:hypothetical protein [Streptomyces sp. ISL-94]|uniref:hypothetical protein n=1 Tax=Streptomyces sp. ISL-94 TaxID=2819190 RepID=UPI001BEA0726|nr:hypothetical protein [Streptomyces sp. ISL-94]MBT2482864.1 hypothetical protein [Streptomyces sp. ISL-94]